jgi:hypothetical protein
VEHYTSPPTETVGRRPTRIWWDADTPGNSEVRLQIRMAGRGEDLSDAGWTGPAGIGSYYARSGETVTVAARAPELIQFRAGLVSSDGCASAKLREVRIDFED